MKMKIKNNHEKIPQTENKMKMKIKTNFKNHEDRK